MLEVLLLCTGDLGHPALCPKGAPCACPTPAALAVQGAAYGCYNPQQYHCDAAQLVKTQNGLVAGPGVSTAGACPQTGKTNLHCSLSLRASSRMKSLGEAKLDSDFLVCKPCHV